VPANQIFEIIGQYPQSPKVLQVSNLFSPYEDLAFSIIIGLVTGLPLECTAVNLLHNTSSNCTNFGCLFVACQCPSHFHFML